MSEELKPCPFCGRKPSLLEVPLSPEFMEYQIDCEGCDCSMQTGAFDYKDEKIKLEKIGGLIERWNKRFLLRADILQEGKINEILFHCEAMREKHWITTSYPAKDGTLKFKREDLKKLLIYRHYCGKVEAIHDILQKINN